MEVFSRRGLHNLLLKPSAPAVPHFSSPMLARNVTVLLPLGHGGQKSHFLVLDFMNGFLDGLEVRRLVPGRDWRRPLPPRKGCCCRGDDILVVAVDILAGKFVLLVDWVMRSWVDLF